MPLTKLNNKSVANVTSIPVALGDMVLVSSATASSSASIEFTLGDYKEYKFFFVNMHPATDNVDLQFQGSTDSGSTYATTITSTFFLANHSEADATNFEYFGSKDLAQSTSFQTIGRRVGNDNDQQSSGTLQIFNPSSTTFVKHFIARFNTYIDADYSEENYIAGYFNTTSALTNIKFQMSSGNIDDGKILMFGIN